jgi:hypothetical protein
MGRNIPTSIWTRHGWSLLEGVSSSQLEDLPWSLFLHDFSLTESTYNNHFSISNPTAILYILFLLWFRTGIIFTGPVTTSNGPVTQYTCPVMTNWVKYRKVYYRY